MTGSPSTPSRPLCPRTAAGRHPPRPGARPLTAIPAQAGGQAIITLAGDIDLVTAGDVREAARRCLRGHPARLLLDLRRVGFCDAAGARALRLARDEAAAAGAEFRLVAPRPAGHPRAHPHRRRRPAACRDASPAGARRRPSAA